MQYLVAGLASSVQLRGAIMYVIVQRDAGHIFAFGATPKKASADFVRRDIWIDEPSFQTIVAHQRSIVCLRPRLGMAQLSLGAVSIAAVSRCGPTADRL
jgi:hypothetical protein